MAAYGALCSVRPAGEEGRAQAGDGSAQGRSAGPCQSCPSQPGLTTRSSLWSGRRPLLRRSPRTRRFTAMAVITSPPTGRAGQESGGARLRGARPWARTPSQTRAVAGAGKAPHSLRPSQVTAGRVHAGRSRGICGSSGAPRPSGLKGQRRVRTAWKTEPWESRHITCSSTDTCVWPKRQKSPHTSEQTGRGHRPRRECPQGHESPRHSAPRLSHAGLVLTAGRAPLHV